MGKDKLQQERELIYLFLHSKDAIRGALDSGLSHRHFGEETRPIVLSILESYEMNDILLTRAGFKDKLSKFSVPKDRIAQELAFNSCYRATSDINDLPHLIANISENYVSETTNKFLETFKHSTSKLGIVPALKELTGSCESLLDGTNLRGGATTYYDSICELSKTRTQYINDVMSGKIVEEPPILTGIREIDYTMAVGLEQGNLTLFCADVGGFKSSMMLNIALNVWSSNYDVLFVPLEMHRDQMWRRAMSIDARIDSRLFARDFKSNLTEEHLKKMKEINESWNKRPAHLFIMQEPGNTTVLTIERLIERNIEMVQPKLVVIDYVANLQEHKARYGRNDLEIGDMLKAMRQMGKDLGFHTISGAQLGRDALKRIRKAGANKDKPTVNSEDIRGSHEYSADADNIYAQLISTSQPNQLLDLYCVKSRHGPNLFEGDNVRAVLEVNPAWGLIRSQPLEGEIDNEVNDIMGDFMDKSEMDKDIIKKGQYFDDDDDIFESAPPAIDDEDVEDIANTIDTNDVW